MASPRKKPGVCGLLCATVVAAATATSQRAHGSPQEVIGFGFRSIGMGTTGAAVGQGVDTVYANPALLSLSHEMALQLGITGAVFNLHADGPGMPGPLSYSPMRANTIGGLLPLPFRGALADRVTIGLGFQTPFDVVVRGRILYPETPQFLMADRVQSVAVQAAMGMDLGYGIRIGGGFAALAALTGSVVVATNEAGRIGTVVKDTLVVSFAPIFGASYDLTDEVRLGVVVRGELVGRFNVVIEARDLGQLDIPPLNISGVAQYDPWQVGVEAAYVKAPWNVGLGFVFKHWSVYPGPIEATVRCEDTPDPDTECDPWLPPTPNYHDTIAPRVGVERDFEVAEGALIKLRVGYAFEPTPAPPQRSLTNYFDNTRSILSFGWGVSLSEPLPPLDFDGFFQGQLLHPRTHPKSVAYESQTQGDVRSWGNVISAGVAATVRF